ncbi:MAG TPA: extracellular solute-binding protein [Pirellulales bacterium]
MLAVLLVPFVGCAPQQKSETPAARPLAGVELNLLIVDDEALARSVTLLHGQWEEETGSKLHVTQISEPDLAQQSANGKLAGDAVIYAPRLLGTLATAGAIQPIAASSLQDPELDWADVFELIKTREVTWGIDVDAIPLGSPVLLCCYREDLLRESGLKPPRTWQEYQEVAAKMAVPSGRPATENADGGTADGEKSGNWSGTIEPLSRGWAGLTLLARAAAYARHANHYSTLFNMQTMEPLVASPPFVRALEELRAANRLSSGASQKASPTDAWQALITNRTGMALCWPNTAAPASGGNEPERSADVLEIGCVEIPGAVDVYNASSTAWERRAGGAARVPVLGMAGRMGSILKNSKYPQAAFKLLAWLASHKWNERAVASSAGTAPFRTSQAASPEAWSRGLRVGEAKQYGAAVAATLSSPDCLVVPRIPGAARYLQALDDAVQLALEEQASPDEALRSAAEQFRAITAELGLERQRDAYQRSLGL